jgi:hypothetical protein
VLPQIKKALKNQDFCELFVDPLGLEPRTTGPKPAVLPLHHGSIHFLFKSVANLIPLFGLVKPFGKKIQGFWVLGSGFWVLGSG